MAIYAYPCGGMSEQPQGNYSRLCVCDSGDWPEHDPIQLAILASQMRDSPAKRAARQEETNKVTTVPSGYVYFGQFIDHEITKDNRYLADAIPQVEETGNFRTARLDLETLYGTDPATVPCIYAEAGRLKLAPTLKDNARDGKPLSSSWDDLPRTDDGTAILIDPRNDENLIVAQLHVLFIKFHNLALELLSKQPDLSPIASTDLFEQARRFVTWHYQWMVLHDFLPLIARLAVLKDIRRSGSRPRIYHRWYTPKDAPMKLPVEFSVAAFRFGHSMVREQYSLNSNVGGANSCAIIYMTKRGGGITSQLPASYVIDWSRFFGKRPAHLNRAQVIDTFITEMLYGLPKQTEQAFRRQFSLADANFVLPNQKMMPPLPETTLKRGSKIRLASGEEFASRFKLDVLPPEVLFPGQEEFFKYGLGGRTPLWYYVLREAMVEPASEPALPPTNRPLRKLGTLGSRIVAETLYQLLLADADSILNAGRHWKPPTFNFGAGNQKWCLESMPQLVRFVESLT